MARLQRRRDSLEVDGYEIDEYISYLSLMEQLYTSDKNPCKAPTMSANADTITFAYFPETYKNSETFDCYQKSNDVMKTRSCTKNEDLMSRSEDVWNNSRKTSNCNEVNEEEKIEYPGEREIAELLEYVRCPECHCMNVAKVKTADSSDELNVRYCKDCNAHFGADDTMDLDDLEKLYSEHKVIVKPTAICQCGNDDVDELVLIEHKSTGQPVVECQRCKKIIILGTVAKHDEDDDWLLVNRVIDGDHGRNTAKGTSKGESGSCTSIEDPSDRDRSQFFCDKCGNGVYDVFEKNYDVNGSVTSVKCLRCDDVQQLTTNRIIVCPNCSNDDGDKFEHFYDANGRSISALCRICENVLTLPRRNYCSTDCNRTSDSIPRDDAGRWKNREPIQRRVSSLADVSVGDHVGWKKDYVISHHAIVVGVRPRDDKIRVVHYTGAIRKHDGHFVSIREEDVRVDLKKELFYIYDYGECCHVPEVVIERARSRLGEHSYNLFKQNCEHFARWCKTGVERSGQVKAFCRRFWKVCGGAAASTVREGVTTVCKGLSVPKLLQVGVHSGTGSGAAAAAVGGAVVFDVFLNLALEIGLFAYCTFRANARYKAGKMTKQQFHREVCQTGCECLAGFVGGTGGGFLGQLVIPVPFLGTLIGCTLGTLIGRFLGSIAGKKISDRYFDKKK